MTEQEFAPAGSGSHVAGGNCALVPKPDLYVQSEGIYVSAAPCTIMTILGSCVAVCLWDPTNGAGGMNHYLLPHSLKPEVRAGRFGTTAIRVLIERLEALGSRRRELRGKVFGGACINGRGMNDSFNLGRKNVEVAFAALEREAIPILGHDVGGGSGRRVLFHTSDGAAWVKHIGDGADGTR